MHRLQCFVRLAIENPDGDRVDLRSRKHLALLVYLAAHTGRRYERKRVARLLWDTELVKLPRFRGRGDIEDFLFRAAFFRGMPRSALTMRGVAVAVAIAPCRVCNCLFCRPHI